MTGWLGQKMGSLHLKPHDNAKSSMLYVQTKLSLLASFTEPLKDATTAEAYSKAFDIAGGIDFPDMFDADETRNRPAKTSYAARELLQTSVK